MTDLAQSGVGVPVAVDQRFYAEGGGGRVIKDQVHLPVEEVGDVE
jgi:hypothetical protein